MAALLLREAGCLGQILRASLVCQSNHKTLTTKVLASLSARHAHFCSCQRLPLSLSTWEDASCQSKGGVVYQPQRGVASKAGSESVQEVSVAPDTVQKVQPSVELPSEIDLYKERYIPITRRSVIRQLVEEKDFLLENEQKNFEDFALALDSAIVNKYHGILQELKVLFDPINPDKDTIQTRKWTRRERLDNEFWLLQRLEDVMEKANFHELPKSVVGQALEEHQAREGVRVSVDPDKYDILRFWALGKETPVITTSLFQKLSSQITKRTPPEPMEFYKRVVVAVRLKKDQKLILKAFKEVPVNALEMLLPDGKVAMSKLDKGILATSVAIAATGILAKIVTVLASVNVDWTLIFTAVTGLIGMRSWTVYKNRRNAYMVDLSRMLYFKNIANNRGLLTLLVDRAEDESFKEALLTYSFLLTQRPPSARTRSGSGEVSDPTVMLLVPIAGGITELQLEKNVERWVDDKANISIDFDSSEAIKLLKGFGILSIHGDKLHVLSMEAAMRHLPQQPQSVVARAMDVDIAEGFDRDEYAETEQEYKAEEKKSKRFGWF